VAGYAVDALSKVKSRHARKILPAALAVPALVVGTFQMVSLNFFHYDDDRYPYVYAHTTREFLGLIDEIDRIARLTGKNEEINITMVSPEYWPLPWYLRKYEHVGYFARLVSTNEPIVIASEAQQAEIPAYLGDRYRQVGSFPLRPGVVLLLYVRNDIPA
jgi:predicted membrane-bound mannosyltransferase